VLFKKPVAKNLKDVAMDEMYTDEQLNIGKVLVVGSGHKLKISQIKQLIRADKVRKIKWSGNVDDVDTFVLSVICRAIIALKIDDLIDADLYRVDGDGTAMTMLGIKTGGKCKTVNLDAKNIKRLHNAIFTKDRIDRAKRQMDRAIESHNDLSAILTKQKIKNGMKKKTNALDKIVQGYADDELAATLEKIKDVMSNTW
jgi:hypothetical protein